MALDPAVIRELTLFVIAATGLIRAVWPHGIFR